MSRLPALALNGRTIQLPKGHAIMRGMSERERNLRDEMAAYHATMLAVVTRSESGETLGRDDLDKFDDAERKMRTARAEFGLLRSAPADNGLWRGAAAPATPEDAAFTSYLRSGTRSPELRAAGEANGSQGGFLVPQSFWNKLAIALKQFGGMSQYFDQVETPDGRVMPFPTNNPTGVSASYVSENTQVGNTDYVFGEGVMMAWMIDTGVMKASLQLVQDSATDVDTFIAARSGESLGRKIATEAVSGAGSASNAGTGINTALNAYGALSGSAGGVLTLGSATAVKMFSGTTTELAANVLSPATAFSMIAGVDPAYWPGCAFYMNATQALNMRQVVDSNGRPLLNFDNGYVDGALGNIGGFPVRTANEIPNLSASTLGGPIFGNMEHAMVQRTVAGGTVMALHERYADFLQVGYIGYQRFDIQPVDLRAAVVVKAAST